MFNLKHRTILVKHEHWACWGIVILAICTFAYAINCYVVFMRSICTIANNPYTYCSFHVELRFLSFTAWLKFQGFSPACEIVVYSSCCCIVQLPVASCICTLVTIHSLESSILYIIFTTGIELSITTRITISLYYIVVNRSHYFTTYYWWGFCNTITGHLNLVIC